MKISPKQFPPSLPSSRAFTLSEIMITMAIFAFVFMAVIQLHIFGLKLNKMVDVRLQATESARSAVSKLATDIHIAGVVQVGTGDTNSFTEAASNTPQQGNAIQIYPVKTNMTRFVRYFVDPGSKQLMRLASGGAAPSSISGSVTNTLIFTSEDSAGNILTNDSNNRVIGINLQFYQLDNTTIHFSHGNYFDYYRLQTRVTRRALE